MTGAAASWDTASDAGGVDASPDGKGASVAGVVAASFGAALAATPEEDVGAADGWEDAGCKDDGCVEDAGCVDDPVPAADPAAAGWFPCCCACAKAKGAKASITAASIP
jgi:hypothetical protein